LVVPVRDESATIRSLLRCIEAQSRPPDEVILVDGGSIDRTPDIIREATVGDDRFRLLEIGPATPGRGRNEGIRAAAHDWVALTDAGVELDRNWLARLLVVAEQDPNADVVYGAFRPSRGSIFERLADIAYVSPLESSGVGPVRSRSIASALLRRQAWADAGEFPDLRAAEDRIFMRRLDEIGCRTAVAPEAVVLWQLQPSLGATFRRFRRYSTVNVIAGEQRTWHHGIARQYVVALVVAGFAALFGRRWAGVVLGVGGAARVGWTTWRRREGRGILWALNPARMAGVGGVLAVTDAATFAGWYDAIRRRQATG
jgi:glycosyltransferase involved in cell wall biosynthesis